MMKQQQQSLLIVVLMVILSTVTCSQLTLVPYAYLADPLPVYHQSQNTRTGEHAYSYSGGPSAKEEVKGPDGVTRGSYSYLDAHGILQSVFYVADEGGFRVAATNLPTDTDLPIETADVILAKKALYEEHAKTESSSSSSSSSSDDEKQSSTITRDKHMADENDSNKKQDDTSVNGKPYGALANILLPGSSIPTATSHQSHLRIHQNIRTESGAGIEPITNRNNTVEAAAAAATPVLPILTDPIELNTVHFLKSPITVLVSKDNHQNHIQVLPIPTDSIEFKTIDVIKSPITVLVSKDNHQNRVLIHRNLGLEGEQSNKDAVKIETVQQQPIPILTKLHTLVPGPVAILDQRPSSSIVTDVPLKTITSTHLNGNESKDDARDNLNDQSNQKNTEESVKL